MKSWKLEAVILAIGMLVMGYFIKQGLDTFSGGDSYWSPWIHIRTNRFDQ